MLGKISPQKLRNSEFLQFNNNVSEIVAANDPQALLVLNLYNPFKASITSAEALFKKELASSLTEELAVLDDKRDDLLMGISNYIDAHTHHYDEAIKKNALALQVNLASYGTTTDIAKENYQSESTVLKKLITDWTTKPELVAAAAAINLTPWIGQLDAANTAFNSKFLERNKQQGAAPTDKLKEKRSEVMVAYDKLTDRINSYFDINEGADPFGKVTRELNMLIEKYNKLIAGRGKGAGIPPTPAPPAK
ncbi:MAG: DUF6261 family protein [Cyclobacteriaceae bacterium]|nr:DUF6261 family protein [Cyclobacteriaceae bacterium]